MLALLSSCAQETLTDPQTVIASWNTSSSIEGISSLDPLLSSDAASSAVLNSSSVGTSSLAAISSATGSSSSIIKVSSSSSATLQSSSVGISSSSSGCSGMTGTTFTDCRDGQVYSHVTINGVVWMAQNLNYDTLDGAGSWCYNNTASNCSARGRLYNWTTANKVCPAGWHLATDSDWQSVEFYLGMTTTAAAATGWRGTDQGTQLKANSSLWTSNTGSNTIGFSALPSGVYVGGTFSNLGTHGYFWTATASGSNAYYRLLNDAKATINRTAGVEGSAFAVRCVQD